MIKAGLFDVGGVLHKNTLFAPGDFALAHFDLSESDFKDHYAHIEVLALVKKLKDQHMQLAIISNTIREHALYLTQQGLYDDFDELVLSYQVDVRKPDPKIFEIALDKLGVDADETFFVDDLSENVDAANRLGIHGILFTSADELRKEIAKLDIKI